MCEIANKSKYINIVPDKTLLEQSATTYKQPPTAPPFTVWYQCSECGYEKKIHTYATYHYSVKCRNEQCTQIWTKEIMPIEQLEFDWKKRNGKIS